MNVPPIYVALTAQLPRLEASFGVGGITLVPPQSVEAAQVGYSTARDGTPLVSNEPGSWKRSWLVIGNETSLGDPVFMDVEDPKFPVFTAFHGEGSWEPLPIAVSLKAFVACFKEFAVVAKDRDSPGALHDHPLEEKERDRFIARVAEINAGSTGHDFWEAAVSC